MGCVGPKKVQGQQKPGKPTNQNQKTEKPIRNPQNQKKQMKNDTAINGLGGNQNQQGLPKLSNKLTSKVDVDYQIIKKDIDGQKAINQKRMNPEQMASNVINFQKMMNDQPRLGNKPILLKRIILDVNKPQDNKLNEISIEQKSKEDGSTMNKSDPNSGVDAIKAHNSINVADYIDDKQIKEEIGMRVLGQSMPQSKILVH